MKTYQRCLTVTTCVGLLLFAAAMLADDHERVGNLLDQGHFCMVKGATGQAIEDFTEAAHLEPKNPVPYYERGRAYNASGGCEPYPDDFPGHLKNIQRANANFSEAIRLNPNYSDAYCQRASTYLRLGDFDKAIADCTLALGLDKVHSCEMYVTRGDAYLAKGNTDKAFEDFTKAVEWNGHACVSRGKIFQARGEFDKAMADYDKAVRLRTSEGFLARGDACAIKRNWDQAISDFTTAYEEMFGGVDILLARGKVYLEKGDFDKAISDFNEIIKFEPEQQREIYCNPEAYRCRGLAYQKKGMKDLAEKDFAEAKKVDRFDSFRRGESFMFKRDTARAVAAFTDAIRLDPIESLAYYRRANAYIRQGDLQRAIADYNDAIRLKPAQYDSLLTSRYFEKRGIAHLKLSEFNMAIADCTEAIRVLPREVIAVDAFICRGQAYMQNGDFDKAIADFSQATDHSDEGFYHRGEALSRKGDLDKAISDFSEDIRRDAITTGDAYLSRGKAYAERGEPENAIADFTEIIDRVDLLFYGGKPRDAEAYYRRGLVHDKKGEAEQAEKDFAQARTLGYEK